MISEIARGHILENEAKIALDLQSLMQEHRPAERSIITTGIIELLAANRIWRGEAK